MRVLIFNIAAALLWSVSAQATTDADREIHKTFRVNSNVVLDVQTDFATLDIRTWSKNEMDVVITVTANAKSESREKELLDRVTTSLSEGMDLVKLKAHMEGVSCKGSESINIKMVVQMPVTGSVRGSSEFGNLTLTNLNGPLNFHLQYGNLTAQTLSSSSNDCSVEFGNTTIESFGGGQFHSQYGNSKINAVKGAGSIRAEFGNLDVGPITHKSGTLDIQCEFGDLDVVFSKGGDFQFEVRTSFGDIDLPSGVQGKVTKKDYTSEEIKGRVGSGGSAIVRLDSEFGDVDIR
jgi:hypothetical protein